MSHAHRRRRLRAGHALALLAALGLSGCGGAAPPQEESADAPSEALFEEPQAHGEEGAGARDDGSTPLRFADRTAASGLAHRHEPGYSSERYFPEIMGSGLAVADMDRDGDADVLVAGGGSIAEDNPPGSGPRLYLNDGTGRFQEAGEAWAMPHRGYGQGVAVGDVDGDGWTDVFLSTWGGGDTLLRNTGAGFEDLTEASGLASGPRDWSASAGFLDMEGDGDLDLWVTRYIDFDPADAVKCWDGSVHVYCTPLLYDAQPDRLFRNEGDGTFTDVSAEAGLDDAPAKSLALSIGDVDGDGRVDVYVANDITPNHLWLNQGEGRFEEVAQVAGVALSEDGREEAGMGADITDVDGDGRTDIANSNFQTETTNLYRQSQPLFFDEVSDAMGIGETARARLSWGLRFVDLDLDGDEDLLVANGHIYDNIQEVTDRVSFAQPNSLYELRDGRFVDVTTIAGDALADEQVSRGLATGDLDGDGAPDYVVLNNGGTLQVAGNESEVGGFLGLWLEGDPSNRSAIGSRVVARVGEREVRTLVRGASSYLSASDPRILLGLGDAEAADEVTIVWPDGQEQSLGRQEAGRWLHVVQGREPEPFTPGAEVIAP